jgi:hypothetical protein
MTNVIGCVSSMQKSKYNGGVLSLWVIRLLDNVQIDVML